VLHRAYRDSAVQMEVDAPESLARILDAYVISSHRRGAETRGKVR
jgi:hypothetical protein